MSERFHLAMKENLGGYHASHLTAAQEVALSALGEGLDDHEGASRLGCASGTVRTHRAAIMRKLGLHHRGELMRYALCQNYVRFVSGRVLHPGFERRFARLAGVGPGTRLAGAASVGADEAVQSRR